VAKPGTQIRNCLCISLVAGYLWGRALVNTIDQ
jgi:hypothetical protein